MWCYLSTFLPVPWGVKKKLCVCPWNSLPFYLPCRVSLVWHHSYSTRGRWCWRKQEAHGTSLLFIPSLNRGRRSVEFRCVPDSQALGTGSGIRRQIPFFHAYVSSVIAFCLINYFLCSKGAHLKLRRLAFNKQLCVSAVAASLGLSARRSPKWSASLTQHYFQDRLSPSVYDSSLQRGRLEQL